MNQDVQTRESSNAPAAGTASAERQQRYLESALTPPVDVFEDANGITLYADLPGVSRDKLDLQIESDTLTIEAESAIAAPEGLVSHHTEVGSPRFRRVFTLSKELDAEKVSAELAQGVLTLRIPKAAHAKPRRVEVRVG